MSGFAVMVRGVDDTFTAYGPVRDQARAESWAGWFNARVEQYEAAHPDDRDGIAWAYVLPLSKPGSDRMLKDSGLADQRETGELSAWVVHLSCGHTATYTDGAPLANAFCRVCHKFRPITRRFKDGRETC